jgi:NADH-quinone oxidoreductase subunit J
LENTLFYLTAAGAIAGALGVVLGRNPVGNVIALLACFFCLATIYLLAGFQFLAAAQILVYAGAIMVLFLFVIMLLNLGHAGPLPRIDREMFHQRRSTIAIVSAAGFLAVSALALARFRAPPIVGTVPDEGLDAPMILATSLFGRYAMPFEAASLLLLAAAIAVVVLAKRERGPKDRPGLDSDSPSGGSGRS